MNFSHLALRSVGMVSMLAIAIPLAAQDAPADLTTIPAVSTDYQPKKTAWGDPDLRGTWPINDVAEMPVNRPDQYGNRFFKTNEERPTRNLPPSRRA